MYNARIRDSCLGSGYARMKTHFHLPVAACLAAILATTILAVPTRAADDAAGIEFFQKQVRPILSQRCFKCHSHAADNMQSGLTLDSRSGLIEGGESGPAIVPGKPDESLLIQAVRGQDGFEMPPGGRKLSAKDVATLVDWVKRGAPWPDEPPPKASAAPGPRKRKPGPITDEERQWWAFQPIRAAQPPKVMDNRWPQGDLDRFVLAKIEAAGIAPSPPADPTAIIRRVTFDLTGLPPTPTETAAFVAAWKQYQPGKDSVDPYAELVDRLLASPRYGERWARHWLDLVRYADSDGYRIDDYRPRAWHYRDYIIRSLNEDKPYDRFIAEQLAGDELYPDDPDALIATGYLRHWIYEYNARDVRGQWTAIMNDVTDTTADVFLGLGLQCARCHDHKFDPLLQQDYFRLQAYFGSLNPRDDLIAATSAEKDEYEKKLAVWNEKTADLRAEIEEIEGPLRDKAEAGAVKKFPDDIQAMIRKPVPERAPLERQLADLAYRQVYYEWDRLDRNLKGDAKEKLLELRRKLAAFDWQKPEPLRSIMAATDLGPEAAPVLIPKKGQEPIPPGLPTIIEAHPAKIPPLATSTGRRRSTPASTRSASSSPTRSCGTWSITAGSSPRSSTWKTPSRPCR